MKGKGRELNFEEYSKICSGGGGGLRKTTKKVRVGAVRSLIICQKLSAPNPY
jgi:hypothetical protein